MSNPWGIDPEVWDTLDHGNRKYVVITSSVVLMAFATLFVSLRIYTRHAIMNQLWLDDYLAMVALASMLCTSTLADVQTAYGLGCHLWDLKSLAETYKFWKIFYLTSVLYNVALLFLKLSLFFQYYRLIQQVPKYTHIYLGIMAVVASWSIAQVLVFAFQWFVSSFIPPVPSSPKGANVPSSTPVEKNWTTTNSGHCLDRTALVWINSLGNIVTDTIVLLLPLPVVLRLNLTRQQRWEVIPIFGLGFVTCVISICRLVFYTMMSEDVSYSFVGVVIWGQAELTSGLICSALITLRPLVRIGAPWAWRLTRRRTRTSDNIKLYTVGKASRRSPLPGEEDQYHHHHHSSRSKKSSRKGYEGSQTELTGHDHDHDLERADQQQHPLQQHPLQQQHRQNQQQQQQQQRSGRKVVSFHSANKDEQQRSRTNKGGATTNSLLSSISRSIMSTASRDRDHEYNPTTTTTSMSSAHRNDRVLGLESAFHTVISSGDADSVRSASPPPLQQQPLQPLSRSSSRAPAASPRGSCRRGSGGGGGTGGGIGASNGIVVKSMWSVREKESSDGETSGEQEEEEEASQAAAYRV
ncbi:hypothetical protein GGR56DRAFT_679495 [Xylariaceae sp. FL0804]|nr:hypothetical protein GGR56DRAFT_679495 [Xylariaceae sp. FL0804]